MSAVSKVESSEKPRCIRCGKTRPLSELKGYNLHAEQGKQFEHAYCADLSACKSSHDDDIYDDLIEHKA